jgi:hypothetical protein
VCGRCIGLSRAAADMIGVGGTARVRAGMTDIRRDLSSTGLGICRVSAQIHLMLLPYVIITLNSLPSGGWEVVARFSGGLHEQVICFESREIAEEWVCGSEMTTWLKSRGMESKPSASDAGLL